MTVTDTVKIQMTHELEGMPFDFDTTVDTGIPDEQWNAMTHEQRDAVCQPLLTAWVATITNTWWEVIDD